MMRWRWLCRGNMEAVNTSRQDTSPEAIAAAIDHAYQVGLSHLQKIETWVRLPTAGLRVLEIGPGPNYGSTMMMAAFGASVAVADRWLPPWSDAYHRPFYAGLADRIAREHADADPSGLRALAAAGAHDPRIIAAHDDAERLIDAPAGHFDLVISNAVFEHIVDVGLATRRIFEVLRPGGVSCHQVDLRDHRDFSRPLEYLLMSAQEEARWLAQSEHHQGCQRRRSDYEAAFARAGFDTLSEYITLRAEEDYLADLLPRLRKANPQRHERLRDDPTLGHLGMTYVHRKPEAARPEPAHPELARPVSAPGAAGPAA
jgi:SAM-dependent methyltransferase